MASSQPGSNKAYNYDFKLFLEGIEIPFYSANISATPNGVEAQVNIHESAGVYDIKPKTTVQLFYRDWVDFGKEEGEGDGKKKWRLLFNGNFCKFYKIDQAQSDRMVSLICRDFRSDIRKLPSTLINAANTTLGIYDYNTMGLRGEYTINYNGSNTAVITAGKRSVQNKAINQLWFMLARVAGVSMGEGGDSYDIYNTEGYQSLISDLLKKDTDSSKDFQYGFFLDAIARGIWLESVASSSAAIFFNKRVRMEKNLFIPQNEAGTFMFRKQVNGVGEHDDALMQTILGGSNYNSVEAVIMRLAAVFSSSPYSCATPSRIDVSGANETVNNTMDGRTRKFLLKEESQFGAPIITNQGMILPPMEFTSPPNCNLIMPCMYSRVEWDYDFDIDATRARYGLNNYFATNSNDIGKSTIALPYALAGEGGLYLTERERYVGTNLIQGRISNELIDEDARSSFLNTTYGAESYEEAQKIISKLKDKKVESDGANEAATNDPDIKAKIERLEQAIKEADQLNNKSYFGRTNAIKHHARLQFFNSRFNGRACSIEMTFNPFIMPGFPGAVLSGENAFHAGEAKTIIGMVQQVKHIITVMPTGGSATTSVMMNNARFEDEPTDMDDSGSPLYMKATDKTLAAVNPEYKYSNSLYFPPPPKSRNQFRTKNNEIFDLDIDTGSVGEYKYVKDLTCITNDQKQNGITNRAYLDAAYEPSRIPNFYKHVLGIPHSFMVEAGDKPGKLFAFDSMHEAFVNLRKNHASFLYNYEDAVRYTYRRVINANEFMVGIMNYSRKTTRDRVQTSGRSSTLLNEIIYSNKYDGANVSGEKMDQEYYGVATDDYESKKGFYNDRNLEPGKCSSIRERSPATALIEERKTAIRRYKIEATKSSQI